MFNVGVETEMLIQITIALFLGGLLGFERESAGKAAGLRTYALVAAGAALFTIISRNGFNDLTLLEVSRYDPSRIASNIVVGIGFLGAGIIIFRGVKIEGLTTAAGMWVAAGIGMAIGAQMYLLATFTTFLVFFVLDVMGKIEFEDKLRRRRRD